METTVNPEISRLANLQTYQILDTPSEREFEELARFAATLCETPIALISIVSEKRLWFKAKFGMSETGLDRAGSFCTEAIEGNGPFMVTDTTFDTRFSSHPLVTGPSHIRFYAGVPLISREGYKLGTLCVLDLVPRRLDTRQMNFLKMLANQVLALLECNRYREENRIQHQILKDTSKLANFGKLAASIVHELNNPLTILQARATLLSSMVKDGKATLEKVSEAAEKMLETTRRMSKIMNSVTDAMGNEEHEAFTVTSLQVLIDETLSFMMGRFHGGQVEFIYEQPEEAIHLNCKSIQISQVLVNLLNNAHDAVFETKKPNQKWVKLVVKDLKDQVEITVTDGGNALPVAVAQKVFQPFFTTKGVGKGTGLGLSISEEIVKAHGGELTLDVSAKHTTFVVRLPKNPQSS